MQGFRGRYPVKGTPLHTVQRTLQSQSGLVELIELTQVLPGEPPLLIRKQWRKDSDWDELDTYLALGTQSLFPTLFYFDETPSKRSIFIEYCPFGSLTHIDFTTSNSIQRLFTETLEALQVLHEKGLIHRDIKPSNIFMTADRHFKLSDLGSVVHIERCRDFGTLVGTTQGYCCRKIGGKISTLSREEQVAVMKKRDIWALGKTLLECVAHTGMLDMSEMNEETIMKTASLHLREHFAEYLSVITQMLNFDYHRAECSKIRSMLGRSLSLRSTSSSASQHSPPVSTSHKPAKPERPTQVVFNPQLAVQIVTQELAKVEQKEKERLADQLNRLIGQPKMSREAALQLLTRLNELRQRGRFSRFNVQTL